MSDMPRWAVVMIVILLVVGLVAFARGRDHRRGDEIGAMGSRSSAITVAIA